MKKLRGIMVVMLAGVCAFSAAACGGGGGSKPAATSYNGVDYVGTPFLDSITEDGEQTLNMAVMYDSNSYMIYNGGTATLANGVTYQNISQNPMLKPVWSKVEDELNIKIVNKSANSENLANQYSAAQGAGFAGYDILNVGDVNDLNAQGELNMFVDIKPFIENGRMPNLKAFLDANPFIKATIQASGGKMFYAPYFDGYDDLERMFILRADFVRKLLDQSTAVGDNTVVAGLNVYQPFLPAALPAQSLTVVKANGEGTETVSKLATQNIIARMNAAYASGSPTGAELITLMKTYISERYGTYYTNYSDLFIGQNASYDADELVALIRLVKANASYLTGGKTNPSTMWPIYPRNYTNDRVADILRFAQIWGVRGLDSRNGYLYIDESGALQDARMQPDTYNGIRMLNQLYQEGLILKDFSNSGTLAGTLKGAFGDTEFRGKLNANNMGFITYDYNQTTTLLNGLDGNVSATGPHAAKGVETSDPAAMTSVDIVDGFELSPIIPPFTVWKGKTFDTNEKAVLPATLNSDNFYRFTESWRSVKIDGWGITKHASGKKLERALALFDYMYTDAGQKLMSFGPDEWIADSNENASGGVNSNAAGTEIYFGRSVPKLATQTLTELRGLAYGNYTNYYRRFLGGTMPIGYVKDQAMEYQCTHENGKVGQQKINNAIEEGTVKHLLVGSEYSTTTDKTLLSVPTALPFSRSQLNMISQNYALLNSRFDVSPSASSSGSNLLYQYIIFGFGTATSGDYIPTAAKQLTAKAFRNEVINGDLNCNGYIVLCRSAYNKIDI